MEQEVKQVDTNTPSVESDPITLGTGEDTDVSQLPVATDQTLTVVDKASAVEHQTLNKDEEAVTAADGDGDSDTKSGEQWVTFVNCSTGRTFRLPAHTEAEKAGQWRDLPKDTIF